MTKLDFRISAGLKNIIGQELIIDDNVAVFELVKNSYDAYSKKVKIIFKDTKDAAKSRLYIIDYGDGMSSKDIKDKWLFVGYSDKKELLESADYKKGKLAKGERFVAGAKGVGRFSCDRLGATLNMYTRKAGEQNIHVIKVNWKEFELDQNKLFEKIPVDYSESDNVKIEGIELDDWKKGTILEMYPLNSNWDDEKLKGLKKYLQRLINPSSVDPEKEFSIMLEAEEYKETDKNLGVNDRINGPVKNFVFEKLNIKTTQIRCSVDDESITTELLDKGEMVFRLKEKNKEYQHVKNVNIVIFYLNQSAKSTFTRMMGQPPIKYGSIFLYKNNFRIQPYGNEGDDWLRLEMRKGQGYARNLGAREIMGRIELIGAQEDFVEVSSREGVKKTEAFYELVKLFKDKLLRPLERYVTEVIGWDSESIPKKPKSEVNAESLRVLSSLVGRTNDEDTEVYFNPDMLRKLGEKQIDKLPTLIKNVEILEKRVKNPKERKYIKYQLSTMRNIAKKLSAESKALKGELYVKERESLFLKKAVSTDKDVIINLNHTIENSTLTIEGVIDEINQEMKKTKGLDVLAPYIDKINLEVKKISTLAGIVSMANFNLKVASIKKDIVQYITEYLGVVLGNNPDIKFEIENNTEFIMSFKPLEVAMILDNFISNSKKAMASRIILSFGKKDGALHVYIADDGKGITQDVARNLFKRGYTTTSGAGIGLYHIKSMVEGMGGTVRFVGNNHTKKSKGACFEMVFR